MGTSIYVTLAPTVSLNSMGRVWRAHSGLMDYVLSKPWVYATAAGSWGMCG